MSEIVNNKTVFSLLEVTLSIQKTLAERYKNSYWIKAEMNKLNFYSHSGHCYPELVEKKDGKVIAQIKANLWKDDYRKINNNLRMKDEGIFMKNKSLKISLLPQRIAIISVETSKGYADFVKVLQTNQWNYKFFHLLFPSLLQGDRAIDSIKTQLTRIKKVIGHFDAVAIIRGGGGDIGLSCYNNYKLAKEIASFPIPVITGIGHSTNETVVEMIAFTNAITPSKIAEYLIQRFHNFSVPVQNAEEKIIDKATRLISDEKNRFLSEMKLFKSVAENILVENRNQMKALATSLFRQSFFRFKNENESLGNIQVGIKKSIFTFFDICNFSD